MKKLRKVTAMLMAVCLMAVCFSFTALAADGSLQFTDPSAAAGENVTVTAKMRTGGGAIGDGKVTVTYDASALEFISGENASGGNGTVELSATGDGSASELSYTMEFKALKEGQATLSVSGYTAYMYSDESLNLTLGSSTVTITPGSGETTPQEQPADNAQPSGDATTVKIDGKNYTIIDEISEALIPAGFTSTTYKIEGADHNVLVQETSGMYLVYMQGEDGTKDFFLYDKETGTYSPFEQIDISAGNYIMLLKDTSGVKLPNTYKSTTISLSENGPQYPAWQNSDNQEYYVIYALNSSGTKSLYQYDTVEKTYQRFTAPKAEETKKSDGFLGKITDTLKDHMDKAIIIVWVVFIIMLVAIIVAVVKLHHRNQELDDLYDQYGIDSDDDNRYQDQIKVEKKVQKAAVFRKPEPKEDDYYEESDDEFDFDEYDDDDFSDDDDYDEYGSDDEDSDDDYEEFTDDDFEDEDFDDDEYDDDDDEEYDDDDTFENLDDTGDLGDFDDVKEYRKPAGRNKLGRSHTDDSDFKVDFIDLDD